MSGRLRILALACVGVLALGGGVAACTETTRGSYADPDAAAGPEASLPVNDAAGSDSAPSPSDAAPPDLTTPTIACSDAGACVLELVRGQEHFCARLRDGTVRCWGGDAPPGGYPIGTLGYDPQDGGPDAAPYGSRPLPVVGVKDATQISANGFATCAREGDGGLRCWGDNSKGQLGLTTPTGTFDSDRHATPTSPAFSGAVQRVDVSADSVCAQLATGDAWCWGSSTDYRLLRSDPADFSYTLSPGLLPLPKTLGTVVELALGPYSGIARTDAGQLYSWGSNTGDMFGRVSSLPLDTDPLPIILDGRAIALTDSRERACAVVIPRGRDGKDAPRSELQCWGVNEEGELGNGGYGSVAFSDPLPTLSPLPDNVFPQQASSSRFTTCARTSKGAVYCAGSNAAGHLGRPLDFPGSPVLVPITGVETAATVVTGDSTACALLTNGDVVCWGSNELGQLGIATRDDLDHPVPSKVLFE